MPTIFSPSLQPQWHFFSFLYISSPQSYWVATTPLDLMLYSLYGEVVEKGGQLCSSACTCMLMCTSPFRFDRYESLVVEMKWRGSDFCLSDRHEDTLPNADAPQNCLQSTGSQQINHEEFLLPPLRFKHYPFLRLRVMVFWRAEAESWKTTFFFCSFLSEGVNELW